MADEPQDTTADPDEADDDAEEAAVEEPSPSGEADDDTSVEGGEGTADVEHDEEGVAAVTDHSTQLSESEKPDPLRPGQPRGIDPGTLKDRDSPPQ